MIADRSISRKAGDDCVVTQAQSQVQSFFDELKNGTRNYQTIASLGGQIAQEYRGRCILELLQNAHDALANVERDDPQQISFVLTTSPEPVLLVGNSGHPFRIEDFKGICQLGQSPKNPNKSVGNKGLGFRSVLEVSTCPEIWSTAPSGSDRSFVFRFDPSVSDRVAASARELEEQGLDARSPFDPKRPLLDWSQKQLNQYRERLSDTNLDGVREAKKFLSPYLFPLQIEGVLPEVEKLLNAGCSTVVRLCLDGGRVGTSEKAVQSVKDQLQELDARSMVFLSHLEKLVIDIDDERRTLERIVDSDIELSGFQRTRQQRLLVGCSGPAPEDNTTRQFQVWTRIIGGDEDSDQAERIRAVVEHLPNRWPEIRQVAVGIAVEEAPEPEEGVFVIFLPTEMTTGTGAHINAPFYGSLNRRRINFSDYYNKLLLESVLDLCLDAVSELISEEPEDWRAQAVIDLLSSTAMVDGSTWQLMDRLHERAAEQDSALENQALVFCDDGWHIPSGARIMPDISDDNLIDAERWREYAEFAVVSTVLDGRQDAVGALLTKLDGLPSPTHCEWRRTIEQVAMNVQAGKIDVSWDDFFLSVIAVMPADLRDARAGISDLLADMKFLPTQDGRLLSASDPAKLFFQPVRGVDAVAELVGEVPNSVKHLVAFLHEDIRIREEGPQGRNTVVQKFLEDRFVRTFEREELLRVILEALPPLPVSHGGPKSDFCAELFAWTIKLLGNEGLETSLPLIKRLPVACHGGWFAMSEATFGPGWPDRLGDLVRSFADELPEDAATQLRKTILLPPNDPRWRVAVEDRSKLFDRAGVFDGLRLQSVPRVRFHMSQSSYELPAKPPTGTPQTAWDDWRNAMHEQVKPWYTSSLEYTLSEIQLLPEIHYIETLSQSGRHALSRLVLDSLGAWPTGWESATIRKSGGRPWSKSVTSPLKYWLKKLAWFNDGTNVERPLSQRWLVPESLFRGQSDRYSHLAPLSLDLAHKLNNEPKLKAALIGLGINIYPTEDDRMGPELLETLAAAWAANRVPIRLFDMFLGQVRDAWRHFDPDKELPNTFLVWTGRRTFSTTGLDKLADVYLPDDRGRTRSLRERGMPILEMQAADANRMAEVLLAATDIKRASTLKERFLIDGDPWTGVVDGIPTLEETGYAAWLPVTLLTVAAHGGTNPTGATTKTWREAADRLRGARVLECGTIAVELVDNHVVASSELEAQWLPGDVFAIRRDVKLSYEKLAPAAQAMLDRQDLLKDLRLVLGTLADEKDPTSEQIEVAMERAEIDAQALADIRHQWAGNISLLVDRIRPVLELLGVLTDELDAISTDIKCLTEWLSSNLQQWPAPDLLSAAQRSRDDHAMGEAAWCALGDVAQLPAWNEALAMLGDRYVTVENLRADEQTQAHLEEAAPLLRCLACYIAIETGNPKLFRKFEDVRQSFKCGSDWSTRWWEVPFGAVIDDLCAGYAEILGAEHHLAVLEGATTVDSLRTRFHKKGIATDVDPYETADANKRNLKEALHQVHDLHQSWVGLRDSDPIAPEPELPDELNTVAYLQSWSDAELLERALSVIDDTEFFQACDGCVSVDEIRERLGLDQKVIDARREERARREREAERQRRTFKVAGKPFEVGAMSYDELFKRLSSLTDPKGPCASKDVFTPLVDARSGSSNASGGRRKLGKTSKLHPSAEHRELVGVAGEIQAYRFLRAEFGKDVVTRDMWVSDIRLKAMPLVEGEPDNTSDGHGFDFRFRYGGKKWHIEVKATTGDDPQFDLGISEIKAATRFARARGELWRILRIRDALSDQPEFDWLPNPFEENFSKLFRLHKGGMMVSYRRKKT